jgi:hypothetical protein
MVMALPLVFDIHASPMLVPVHHLTGPRLQPPPRSRAVLPSQVFLGVHPVCPAVPFADLRRFFYFF